MTTTAPISVSSALNLCSPNQTVLAAARPKAFSAILKEALSKPGLDGLWFLIEELTKNSAIASNRQFTSHLLDSLDDDSLLARPEGVYARDLYLPNGRKMVIFQDTNQGAQRLTIYLGEKTNQWSLAEDSYIAVDNCSISDLRKEIAEKITINPDYYGQALVSRAERLMPSIELSQLNVEPTL